MLGFAVGEEKVSPGDRSGDEKRAGLDAVRDNGVRRAMQARDALNAKRGSTHTFDLRAHFYQELGEIGDFRFERGIFEDRFTLGQNRSRQNIFCAGDSNFRKAESGATKALAAGFHIAMFDGNLRAQFFERLNVNIDWARSDSATPGQGNAG